MDARRPKVAVICGKAPIPDETFIRREIEALRVDCDVKVFGLGWRAPALCRRNAFRGVPLRDAIALIPRSRTIREIASFVAGGGRIIAHFAWRTADIAAAASRLSGMPWECHVHAWDVFTRPLQETRRRLESASAIVACSRMAAEAVASCGIPAERISVSMHPLPMDRILALKERRRASATDRPFRVIAVGRLVPKKGFDILLRAWPLLPAEILDGARLVIVGDGPEMGRLRALADVPGVPQGSVLFRGGLTEDEALGEMADADIFVLPSRRMPDGDRDGISNAMREAMALGLGVITTDAGAAAEVLRATSDNAPIPSEASAGGLVLHAPVMPAVLAEAIANELARIHNKRT